MVGCALLADISDTLCAAKGDPGTAFGGVNVIFAGDFYQLPPVRQQRLYAHMERASASKKRKSSGIKSVAASGEPGQKNVRGKLLWLSVKTVVLLTEVKRQTGPENEPFLHLLERLRYGRYWTAEPWRGTPMIVNENYMKDDLNIRAAHSFSRRTGRELHWYYTDD
ncbi:hypothetical protein K438DRAFT_1466873, partial [Mycena galopus ATCC 62051]